MGMITGGVSKMIKRPMYNQEPDFRKDLWEYYKTRFDFDWPSQNWMRVCGTNLPLFLLKIELAKKETPAYNIRTT